MLETEAQQYVNRSAKEAFINRRDDGVSHGGAIAFDNVRRRELIIRPGDRDLGEGVGRARVRQSRRRLNDVLKLVENHIA